MAAEKRVLGSCGKRFWSRLSVVSAAMPARASGAMKVIWFCINSRSCSVAAARPNIPPFRTEKKFCDSSRFVIRTVEVVVLL